jgi:hypothetical protein
MKFTPKTQKEIDESNLMPAGIYDFEVVSAENAISKKGNEMITLKLHVFDSEGAARIIFDYLQEALEYKLRHAADACGLIESYETGYLDAPDFIGKCGKVKIKIDKSKEPQYSDKNVVQDYIVEKAKEETATVTGHILEGDEIKF